MKQQHPELEAYWNVCAEYETIDADASRLQFSCIDKLNKSKKRSWKRKMKQLSNLRVAARTRLYDAYQILEESGYLFRKSKRCTRAIDEAYWRAANGEYFDSWYQTE